VVSKVLHIEVKVGFQGFIKVREETKYLLFNIGLSRGGFGRTFSFFFFFFFFFF
jgi:hypothetical protein